LEYEDFEIQIGPRSDEGFRVHVASSPAGEGEGFLELPDDLASFEAARGLHPAQAGGLLFQALFQGEVGHLFHESLHGIGGADRTRGLRLRLRIHPRTPALHQAPWELLHRPSTGDFLALNRFTPIVRSLDVARAPAVPPFTPPLRILFVLSQDSVLQLQGELAKLRKVLAKNPAIEIDELVDPEDPQALRAKLLESPFHVLHYMGHGSFDPESGEGSLSWGALDDKAELSGAHLATTLKDAGALRLVVLNACDTARTTVGSGGSPFAGVATALLQAGIPAVAAMQSPIGDAHAIAFSSAFYGRLALGRPLEEAITEGRHAIFSLRPQEIDWAIPVLFLRSARRGGLFAALEGPNTPLRPWNDRHVARDFRRRTAWTLVLLLAVTQGSASLYRRATEAASVRLVHEPIPGYRPLPWKKKPPGEPRPRAVSAPLPRLEPRSAGDAVHFLIRADARVAGALAAALGRQARALQSFGVPPQTITVEVSPPRLESSDLRGLPRTLCTLSATYSRPGKGSSSVGPVSGSQGDGAAACRSAAETLAETLAAEINANP
jgi:hypothetical protein